MRVYLDAAPVIYTVEEVSPYAPAVDTLLSASEVVQVASDLTRLECRIKPLRNGDAALLKDYDDYTACPNSAVQWACNLYGIDV